MSSPYKWYVLILNTEEKWKEARTKKYYLTGDIESLSFSAFSRSYYADRECEDVTKTTVLELQSFKQIPQIELLISLGLTKQSIEEILREDKKIIL